MWLKQKLAWVLIVLMSIESFSAVVSDNDGAAFITQAEFDSLKNDFQTILNDFNTGIDAKVADAIDTYVRGAKVGSKNTRFKETDAQEWTMYLSSDYPKYEEGHPYIFGTTIKGHSRLASGSDTSVHNNTWSAITIHGKEEYQNDGGFKKHFVKNIGTVSNVIGGNRAYAEYVGYYKKEGEYIVIGGWEGLLNSGTWAHPWENADSISNTQGFNNFVYALVPTKTYNITHYIDDTSQTGGLAGCTDVDVVVQSASRLPGEKVYGNNVSVYQDISDDRFYYESEANRIGITSTTPAIPAGIAGTSFGSWWNAVTGTRSVIYAAARLEPRLDSTTGQRYWVNANNLSFGGWEYDLHYAGAYANTNTVNYLKMSNDPHALQFKYLWTPYTNATATKLQSFLVDAAVSEAVKSDIRNVLIYDGNRTPHLSLIAGYPFLSVRKNEKVSWDFSVLGSTGGVVIGKYGPFGVGEPGTEMNVVWTNGRSGNGRIFDAIAGTTNTLKFTATQDGIVFLKWYKTGGGTLTINTKNDPIVETEN